LIPFFKVYLLKTNDNPFFDSGHSSLNNFDYSENKYCLKKLPALSSPEKANNSQKNSQRL